MPLRTGSEAEQRSGVVIVPATSVSGVVPTTRNINTTLPLTGGGPLSGDLTLGINVFTNAVNGAVPASGGGTVNYLRADQTFSNPIATVVPNSRNINTTLPLTGGGNLGGDLTLGVNLFDGTHSGIVSNPGGATGKFLRDDNTFQPAPGTGTVTSITQGTGMNFSVSPITTTGTINLLVPVSIANGGTGSTIQNFVDLTTNQNPIQGIKTFTNQVIAPIVDFGPASGGGQWANVKAFGAVGDGVTDDTTNIQNCINTLAGLALGGTVFFPTGNYLVSALTTNTTTPLQLRGDGRGSSFLLAKNATSVVLTVGSLNAASTSIVDLGFDDNTAQTGGAYLDLTGATTPVQLRNCEFRDFFKAIRCGGGGVSGGIAIIGCRLKSAVASSVGISLEQPTGGGFFISDCHISAVTAYSSSILNADQVSVTGCYLSGSTNSVLISAGRNQVFSNCIMGDGVGVDVIAIGTANTVNHIRFTGCKINGGSNDCVKISGASNTADISFVDCSITGATQNGIELVGSANITDVRVIGTTITACANDGILVGAATSKWQVIGSVIGSSGIDAGNGNGIVVTAGASDNYQIIGCNLTGNTTNALNEGIGVGNNRVIMGNLPSTLNGGASPTYRLGPALAKYARFGAGAGAGGGGGGALVTGDFVLSGGWGGAPTVTAITGTDAFHTFVVTAGAGTGANPTITLTFHDGTWGTAPAVFAARKDNNAPVGPTLITWTSTATTYVLTTVFTPTSANTYAFCVQVVGQ